jgi:uncharacterized protein
MRTLNRRTFLRAGLSAVAAATAAGAYTWRVEPHWLEIVYRPLPIRGLSPGLAGKTLVHFSDIHVGPRVADDYVVETFKRIGQLRPDIVVITGDLTSYSDTVFRQVESVYRHFPNGRLATLAIPGNHDYGVNWSHPEVAQRVADVVRPFGIEMLRNEMREVEGLQIAGLDDLWADRFDVGPLARLDQTRAALVLTHNPDTVDLPGWDAYEGWILAGHTHGGQCKPPFLPPPLLPVRNTRYTCGEFELSGNRRLYVSRGVGHLLRVRFNVRPEVTIFELRVA